MEREIKVKDTMLKYKVIGSLAVPPNGKLIYSLLTDNADENGELQISIKEIGRSIGISRRAVSNNLHCLGKSGFIRAIPQYHPDGGRAANKYIVR